MSKRKRPEGAKRIATLECLVCGKEYDVITWAVGQLREPTGHRHCPHCGEAIELPRPQPFPFPGHPLFGGGPDAEASGD